MKSDRDDYPDQSTDTNPADLPHKTWRLIGLFLLVVGAVSLAGLVAGHADKEVRRMRGIIGMLASGGLWFGLGLLLFPWTNRMVAGWAGENNFMLWFRKLPLLWKVWLVLAMIVTMGTWVAMSAARK